MADNLPGASRIKGQANHPGQEKGLSPGSVDSGPSSARSQTTQTTIQDFGNAAASAGLPRSSSATTSTTVQGSDLSRPPTWPADGRLISAQALVHNLRVANTTVPITTEKREQRGETHLIPGMGQRHKRNIPGLSNRSRLRFDEDDESDKSHIAPPSLDIQIDQLRSQHTGSRLPRRTPVPPPPPPPKSPSDSSRSTTPRALPRSPSIPSQSTIPRSVPQSPTESVQSRIPRSLPRSSSIPLVQSVPLRHVSRSRPQSLPRSTLLMPFPRSLPRPPSSSLPLSPKYPPQTYQQDQLTLSSIPRSIPTSTLGSTPKSSHSTIRYAQSIASNDETAIGGLEEAMALVQDQLVAAVDGAPAWMGTDSYPEGLGALQELARYLDGLETVRTTVATKYEDISSCIARTFRDYGIRKATGRPVDDDQVQRLLVIRDTYRLTRADLDDTISSASIEFYALLCKVSLP